MSDTKPQTADGKVLSHFAMSLMPAVNVRYRPVSEWCRWLWTVTGSSMLTALSCAWTPPAMRALARGIPRADLLPLEGVGHQMPPRPWWTSVIAVMLRHTCG